MEFVVSVVVFDGIDGQHRFEPGENRLEFTAMERRSTRVVEQSEALTDFLLVEIFEVGGAVEEEGHGEGVRGELRLTEEDQMAVRWIERAGERGQRRRHAHETNGRLSEGSRAGRSELFERHI